MPETTKEKPGKSRPLIPKPNEEERRWVSIFEAMLRQRIVDEKMVNLQRQGRIGFYGPITGQEAATIGSVATLEPQDWVIPALREAGAALYRGLPLATYVAQLFGNSAEASQGRQMPCHHTYKKGNFVSMSSCIGTQLPHAVGIAMAAQYRNDPIVALAYLGDGATSEGDFHAAMNFAGVYRAPVVFFCQNNHWAISLPSEKQTASKGFATKARAYGFEGIQIDGNDVIAVYKNTKKAVDKARKGGGPTMIEAMTYRMGGHTTSDDPSRYRNENEVASWKKKDPIVRMRIFLEKKKLWNKTREDELETRLTSEINTVIRRVEQKAAPELSSMFTDVYRDMPKTLRNQMDRATGKRS